MLDSSLAENLKLARRASPAWSLLRQQQVIWRVRGRKQRKRRAVMISAAAIAAAVCLGVGGYGLYSLPSKTSESAGNTAGPTERWDLRDGSRIVIETPATVITKQRESSTEVSFDLASGIARFDVARRPERAFRVYAGVVRVEVIGTSFRLERQGERSAIAVERGRVLVSWPGGMKGLSAGESGVFPPEPTHSAAVTPVDPESAPEDGRQVEAGRPEPSALGRMEARVTAAPSAAPLGAEALFAAADRARAERKPEEAQRLLAQITQRYPRDARAPLAAFTRGRLLLESLGQPARAARAFAEARTLSGARGTLSEDALAREVEALRAAGDSRAARERAELFRKLYPNGLRLQHVLRSGGLSNQP